MHTILISLNNVRVYFSKFIPPPSPFSFEVCCRGYKNKHVTCQRACLRITVLSFGLINFPEQGFRPTVKMSLKSGLLIQNLNFFDHQPKIVAKIHFQKGNLKFLFFFFHFNHEFKSTLSTLVNIEHCLPNQIGI